MSGRFAGNTKVISAVAAIIVVVSVTSSLITWSLTSRSPTEASTRGAHQCSGNSLSAFEQHQGAGGSVYVNILLVNISTHACTLRGFPVVTLLDSAGRLMRHEPQQDDPWIPPRRVEVPGGGRAGFVMQFPDGPVPGVDPRSGCRAAATLKVTLPHVNQYSEPYTASFQMPLAPCAGGGFSVTALQRGNPLP